VSGASGFAALIPARYASTRFPGKPLADLGGKPMVVHVCERARESGAAPVCVATDDPRIAAAVRAHGFEARMTRAEHASGTERIAEAAVALGLGDERIVVNVQGDEPLIEPAMIEEAIAPFTTDAGLQMGTLRRRIDDAAQVASPHVTKVVVDADDFALYFSRAPIPFLRDAAAGTPLFRHVGLYVYRRGFLLELARQAPTPLEQAEALEQLRALERGARIKAVETRYDSIGVDTPEDLERVRRRLVVRSAPGA
jgi:3-deoxy-manno-octulosonate cytidylyltransferase (CMP-KDO synthetase)